MGLRVIWSYASVDDLEAAAEYLHRDSPAFSSSFVLRALEAARSLSVFPERGRVVPESKNDNIREIFIYNYRLIYRSPKEYRSLHGKRIRVPTAKQFPPGSDSLNWRNENVL